MNKSHGAASIPGGARLRSLVFAALGACLLFGTAHAATVVTDHVVSQARQTQTRVPVTFGQVFKDGDVPRGATVTATFDGRSVPLQVDVKATNPDGSLRHAVLTALIPTLAAGANEPLAISTAAASPAQRPLSLGDLLATRYDATASLKLDGTVYSANARALMQAAQLAHNCAPWATTCGVWLSGPLVSEWIVSGPLTSPNGTVNPNLRAYFYVRAYAGATPGSVAYVRTNFVVENTWAYTPQAQPQYTATLISGSANYTSPALTQYAYTRWHKVLWWNGAEPKVYLRQDTQYIQDSMAVSKYENLQPSESFLAKVRQSCPPLDHCDQTQAMGTTGAQAAIGPLPRWAAVYIIDPDVRAYHWMLANTDALGAYSVHYRDKGTGWPISIQKRPYVTTLGWSWAHTASHSNSARGLIYRKDLLPNCVDDSVLTKRCVPGRYGTGNPDVWNNAHQPAAGYVAYMVTGSYYYMGELAFYASMSELSAGAAYRGYSKGWIDKARGQVRGKAWVLREMVDAAWLLPDGYPLKAEFNADVNNAIANFNAIYTDNPAANPLGLMNSGPVYSLNGGSRNGIAPWQHSFLTWSAGHAADLGFKGADAFRDWLAKFEVGLMTGWLANPTHGYCWLEASAYKIAVKDAAGHWLPNLNAVYAASFPSLVGLRCNSPAMVAAMGKLEKKPWHQNEMPGFPYSAVGFPANSQIGLASAVNGGVPGAAKAWQIFESRSIKPRPPTGYNDYPNFALVPRPPKSVLPGCVGHHACTIIPHLIIKPAKPKQ